MLSFKPFLLEDKPIIDSYLKPHGFQCSEFTFTNMIMWGQDEKIQWAQKDDVLYVLLRFGVEPPFMFPPVPRDFSMDYAKAIDEAAQYFFGIGAMPCFRSISGRFAQLFAQYAPQFTLVEDRDRFDYVYHAADLIELPGKKYHAKRNHINQFTSQYAFTYRPLTPDLADACMALYLNWLGDKDPFLPGILGEMKAIKFVLPNIALLELQGGCIFVGDKLVAFTIGEQINADTAVVHIEKADASYNGLFTAINQQFVSHAFSHLSYINREEDMGIPGMRKAKLSYHPALLIEKFDAVMRP